MCKSSVISLVPAFNLVVLKGKPTASHDSATLDLVSVVTVGQFSITGRSWPQHRRKKVEIKQG